MLNKNHVGLTVGLFVAFMHLIWAIIIIAGLGQSYLNWIFPLHSISNVFSVIPFSLTNAIILIIISFVGGYIFGWLFAALYNKIAKR